MLRLVAEHAHMWNTISALDEFPHKMVVLNEWCARIGRDPGEIERTANVGSLSPSAIEDWLKAGLQHFVVRIRQPFETKEVARLLKVRDS